MTLSEILFYGGLGLMGLAVMGGLCAAVVLRVTGRHLREKLEAEYGKDPRR